MDGRLRGILLCGKWGYSALSLLIFRLLMIYHHRQGRVNIRSVSFLLDLALSVLDTQQSAR